jgi:hypothetical protein
MNIGPLKTVLLVSTLAPTAVPALAADPLCLKLEAATSKTLTMPFHLYLTETRAFSPSLAKGAAMIGMGKTETSEEISTGKQLYISIHGKWRRSPISLADLHKDKSDDPDAKKARDEEKCTGLPDESVDGEPASVYRTENPSLGIVNRIWISKTRQLPLKVESTTEVGSAAKFINAMRYDYKDVSAPDGVR